MPRLRPSCGMCDGAEFSQAADGRDLRARRQIARPGKTPFIDEALGDDVEPRLGRCGAPPGRKAGVEHQLRHLHGDEHVLFQFHHLNRVDAWRVVPGQMQVGVDQPRHQGRSHAVNHGRAAALHRAVPAARRAADNLLDAVTLDHHLAGVRVFAGRIEDPDVGEEDAIQAAGFVVHNLPPCTRFIAVTIIVQLFASVRNTRGKTMSVS